MTMLIPDLTAGAHAATKLKERHITDAGRHLSLAAAGSATAASAAVHRDLAEQHALAAAGARLEQRDLTRLAQGGEA